MSEIIIYKTTDNQTTVEVTFEKDTVWLNRQQLALLFDRDVKTIGKHINNVFKEEELDRSSTVAKFATVQNEGSRLVERNIECYNLDMIISVGYRVNSKRGTQFRQWATLRLKDYLVLGYAINENRLKQKQLEVEYLKTGIRILSRAIEEELENSDNETLKLFAKGLVLLDDYDHGELDSTGRTIIETIYPSTGEYMEIITSMRSDFESGIFAQPKDSSFDSSINQIRQSFNGTELYPSLEEKAATLLYLIVKNHSFVDGNKRIAAACFLTFLQKNKKLLLEDGNPIISNEALATLTLFIAISKPEEMKTVIKLIISILNRNKYLD